SAAIWRDRVFAGSYSKRFFAFDAATGAILWQFKANGPISGSPTVIAGRVYFATLKGTTYGLDAVSGKELWSYPDGRYSPVVADATRLYLVGNARIYGLDERRAATTRTLSAVSAMRKLRAAGFNRLRVVGTRPLAIRLGKGRARARRNVCHIALFGAEVNVARGAAVLHKLCIR
ncbi:MAG: PQQ-binding-like beta-propeller repeat protein, partial [Actinobacteria bacterium]|nr:PQQ-binding-like beta-propeller repeat protein [Actinomycetota bacterium]